MLCMIKDYFVNNDKYIMFFLLKNNNKIMKDNYFFCNDSNLRLVNAIACIANATVTLLIEMVAGLTQ